MSVAVPRASQDAEDDREALDMYNRVLLIKNVRQLQRHLAKRTLYHSDPDPTRTGANLRTFIAFLFKIERTLAATSDGVRTLLRHRRHFDVNRLYRPTNMCTEEEFLQDRNEAVRLWQTLINEANLVLGDRPL